LDHKVLEFAASLPARYKVLGSQGKRVLKAAFARTLPLEIRTRKKAGFPVPYEGWLREQFADAVRDILLSTQARGRGYFHADSLQRLLDRNRTHGTHAKEIFSLLVLEFWHREFVDGN
jgi:asparagine synthase (glutamine-hydrolysing)